jgi:hypothetical protein
VYSLCKCVDLCVHVRGQFNKNVLRSKPSFQIRVRPQAGFSTSLWIWEEDHSSHTPVNRSVASSGVTWMLQVSKYFVFEDAKCMTTSRSAGLFKAFQPGRADHGAHLIFSHQWRFPLQYINAHVCCVLYTCVHYIHVRCIHTKKLNRAHYVQS